MNTADLDTLFLTPTPATLGPGPRPDVWTASQATERARVVARAGGMSDRRSECLVALTLLWHDHFDPAHGLVQEIEGADAAFVHGILHRREPDYSNARYWFHRVGQHAACAALADAAAPVLAAHAALPHRLIRDGRWQPLALIDAVAAHTLHSVDSAEVGVLQELQRLETLALARHFARVAAP